MNAGNLPPLGYERLPEGVRCRCVNLWRDASGAHWCCAPNNKRLPDENDPTHKPTPKAESPQTYVPLASSYRNKPQPMETAMVEISLADYEGLRNVVDNAEAGAAKAALFGTAEEVQKQKRIGAKATAKLVARYSPFELLSRLDNIARHYEARSELYTSDADLAAAMYQLATGPASAQAAENTEERGNG